MIKEIDAKAVCGNSYAEESFYKKNEQREIGREIRREKEKNKNQIKSIFNAIKDKSWPSIFILPSLIPMILFIFYPLLKSIYLSLHMTNAKGEIAQFSGVFNYQDLFYGTDFIDSIVVSGKFTLYTTIFSVLISLFLAIIANEKIKGIGFFRTIFSSTIGISVSAASTIWLFMYHPSLGTLNKFIGYLGIEPINWLTNPKYSLISIIITTVWMEVGFGFLVLTAGLNNISEDIYESAAIDGAGYFQKLKSITLPLLTPSLYYLVTVTIIKSLQSFGQSHILTGGGPANSTTTIVYRLWLEAFTNYRFGFASTIGLILSVVIMIITIFQFKLEKKVHYQ